MSVVRLDKLLADLTNRTRSQVKTDIRKSYVKVNGNICIKNDCKINTEIDKVELNGKKLEIKEKIYIIMNKPAGVVSATVDNIDKTVIDILPENLKRKGLFPVGRLDKDTEGLLIITNDGEYAHKIMSPCKKVYKKYLAKLDGNFTKVMQKDFECGIILNSGEICKPSYTKILDDQQQVVQISICEGMFHQVKKMFASVGLKVLYLQRIEIGSLELDVKLHKGECREMQEYEKQSVFISNLD